MSAGITDYFKFVRIFQIQKFRQSLMLWKIKIEQRDLFFNTLKYIPASFDSSI